MIDLHTLIFKLRDKLNDIGIDHYDDRLCYRDLQDAYDTIKMAADFLDLDIEDTTSFASYKVERCTIRVATYYGYKNYTKLAERQLSTEPQTSPIQIMYDINDAINCLTLLFGTPFNEQLLPEVINIVSRPVTSAVGNSWLDE